MSIPCNTQDFQFAAFHSADRDIEGSCKTNILLRSSKRLLQREKKGTREINHIVVYVSAPLLSRCILRGYVLRPLCEILFSKTMKSAGCSFIILVLILLLNFFPNNYLGKRPIGSYSRQKEKYENIWFYPLFNYGLDLGISVAG